ncbi:MAG: hypothetical protein J07HX64_01687 [halophilic archaeon J07HX64]|jgi:hypothetical protein|nr:MAG: hypothetical protein J07HX64_01687 [halophilic archaeon J07HX64]
MPDDGPDRREQQTNQPQSGYDQSGRNPPTERGQSGPARPQAQTQADSARGQSQRRGGRQPAGRRQGADASVTDILGTESGKRFLLYIVGTFGAVGLGYGVGLMLLSAATGGLGSELFGAGAILVAVLSAPVISMVTGVLTGLRLTASDGESVLVSGVGAFVGFLVMLIIMVVFSALSFDSGGGGGGTAFGPLFAFSTGVAVSGAATTYVLKRLGI